MKPSDFQKTVQCRFESCLKKVVRHVVKDYQQGLKRRKDKEIPFCELPEIFVENFAVRDDYETDYTIFSVCGIDIRFHKQWTGTKKRLKKYWHFMTRTYQSAVCVHSMMNTAMSILL